MANSCFLSCFGLLKDAESIILGCLESFVLLATILRTFHELIEPFDLVIVGQAPYRWVNIIELVDYGVMCAFLEAFFELIFGQSFVVFDCKLVFLDLVVKVETSVT